MNKLPKEYLEELYPTKDIYLASTLLALNFPLIEITKEDKQYTFHLAKDIGIGQTIDEYVEAYWSSTLKIDPKKLWSSYREIKGRMYRQ